MCLEGKDVSGWLGFLVDLEYRLWFSFGDGCVVGRSSWFFVGEEIWG